MNFMKTNNYEKAFEKSEAEIDELLKDALLGFKKRMGQVAEDALSNIYNSYLPYLSGDLFSNLRSEMINNVQYSDVAGREIRKRIFEENKSEIIADLNKDMIQEIKELKEKIERSYNFRSL